VSAPMKANAIQPAQHREPNLIAGQILNLPGSQMTFRPSAQLLDCGSSQVSIPRCYGMPRMRICLDL
jgi:hypothetical protein